jgi:hypothetical protein
MTALTLIHVVISLVGIVSGCVVIFGFLKAKHFGGWVALFLTTTTLTSITGFLLPFHKIMPSHVVGLLSLFVLATATIALYRFRLNGPWRRTFVICSLIAEYFNVFVLVAQLFAKVPALRIAAPTQSEPPFAISQLVVLGLFLLLGTFAVRKSRDKVVAKGA